MLHQWDVWLSKFDMLLFYKSALWSLVQHIDPTSGTLKSGAALFTSPHCLSHISKVTFPSIINGGSRTSIFHDNHWIKIPCFQFFQCFPMFSNVFQCFPVFDGNVSDDDRCGGSRAAWQHLLHLCSSQVTFLSTPFLGTIGWGANVYKPFFCQLLLGGCM